MVKNPPAQSLWDDLEEIDDTITIGGKVVQFSQIPLEYLENLKNRFPKVGEAYQAIQAGQDISEVINPDDFARYQIAHIVVATEGDKPLAQRQASEQMLFKRGRRIDISIAFGKVMRASVEGLDQELPADFGGAPAGAAPRTANRKSRRASTATTRSSPKQRTSKA